MADTVHRYAGVADLLASQGHTGRRRVVLGHTLETLQRVITKISHNVLSKFMILHWAAFIAVLGHMGPVGLGLDTMIGHQYGKPANGSGLHSIELSLEKQPQIIGLLSLPYFSHRTFYCFNYIIVGCIC